MAAKKYVMKPYALKKEALIAYLDPASPTRGKLAETARRVKKANYYNIRDWYIAYKEGRLSIPELDKFPPIISGGPYRGRGPKRKIDGRTLAGKEAKALAKNKARSVVADFPAPKMIAAETAAPAAISEDLLQHNNKLAMELTALKKALKRSQYKNRELSRLVRSLASHVGTGKY
jgi:hypothetical protein